MQVICFESRAVAPNTRKERVFRKRNPLPVSAVGIPGANCPVEVGYASLMEKSVLDCRDIEALVDSYVDGELPTGLELRLKEHIESCDACRAAVEDCQKLLDLARTLDSEPLPLDVHNRLHQRLRAEFGGARPSLRLVK